MKLKELKALVDTAIKLCGEDTYAPYLLDEYGTLVYCVDQLLPKGAIKLKQAHDENRLFAQTTMHTYQDKISWIEYGRPVDRSSMPRVF